MKPTETSAALDTTARPLRNCWTCALSGLCGDECDALTCDEETDWPIIEWLDAAPMAPDGTVPETAGGCPAWKER